MVLSAFSDMESWLATAIGTALFAWMVYTLINLITEFTGAELKVCREETGGAANDEQDKDLSEGEKDEWTLAEQEVIEGEVKHASDQQGGEEVRPSLGNRSPAGGSSDRALINLDAAKASGQAGQEIAMASGGVSPPRSQRAVPMVNEVDDDDDDDDDWEGIEGTTDLEDGFNAAATFVTSLALSHGMKAPQEAQLQLYALYKQATSGPCDSPQPSVFSFGARAKWEAWSKLKEMDADEAMTQYIVLVTQLCPGWDAGDPHKGQGAGSGEGMGGASNVGDAERSSNPMGGPVFSSMLLEDDQAAAHQGKQLPLHACASNGQVEGLQAILVKETDVNLRDEEGRTALHWAADRGHVAAVRFLLAHGASVDALDAEGQTPLHYAAVCEHKELAAVLLEAGADPNTPDQDGSTPAGLRPQSWAWPSFSPAPAPAPAPASSAPADATPGAAPAPAAATSAAAPATAPAGAAAASSDGGQ